MSIPVVMQLYTSSLSSYVAYVRRTDVSRSSNGLRIKGRMRVYSHFDNYSVFLIYSNSWSEMADPSVYINIYPTVSTPTIKFGFYNGAESNNVSYTITGLSVGQWFYFDCYISATSVTSHVKVALDREFQELLVNNTGLDLQHTSFNTSRFSVTGKSTDGEYIYIESKWLEV